MAVERMRRGNGPQLSVEHLSLDIRDDCTLNHPSHHSTRAGPLPLVDIDETPTYLRRPYILRGYRVSYTFWRCVQSVWSVHNESGNIWTHALGFVYFAWLLAACGSEPEQLTPAPTQPAAGPARVKLTYYNVDG